MTLETVTRFRVPRAILDRTESQLRAAGKDGYELFVLWTGVVSEDLFKVVTPHVPHQNSYRLESGLCVRVEGDELHRLNRWLFEAGELLGVQVHTHPEDAYHSETDDTFPMVTILGGLSIVVPDFARHGLEGPGVAAYRLTARGWIDVALTGVSAVLEVVD